MAVVEFPPFVLVSPSLKVGTAPTLKELKCSTNQIAHNVDQDTNDYDTFCGSYRVYGPERHSLVVTIYQNFDTDGPWQVLHPLAGQVVDFEFLPDDRVVSSATNPKMTGQVRVPSIPFVNASVNEASEIEVELSVQGMPTFDTTGTAMAFGASEE